MAEDPFPSIGSVVAGYRIEALLATGPEGSLFLATHRNLARRVALRVVSPQAAADDDFRERFMREPQLAASLDHPNVLPVYDAGEADGVLYVAMRHVAGADLGAILEGGPLS